MPAGVPRGDDPRHQPRAARARRRVGVAAVAAAAGGRRGSCSSNARRRCGPDLPVDEDAIVVDVLAARRVAARARARRRVGGDAHAAPDRGGARRPLRAAGAQPARRRAAAREPARLDGVEPRAARRASTARCSAGWRCSPAASTSTPRGRCARRTTSWARSRGSSTSRSWSPRASATGSPRRSASTPTIACARRASAAAAADRHLDHRLAVARELAPELERDKDRWRATLAPDHDNLRAAIEHGLEADDPTRARELAAELPWLWHLLRQGARGDGRAAAGDRAGARTSGRCSRRGCSWGWRWWPTRPGRWTWSSTPPAGRPSSASEQGDESLLALCLALAAVGRFYTDLDGARETALEAERLAARTGAEFVVYAGRALRGHPPAPARPARGGESRCSARPPRR